MTNHRLSSRLQRACHGGTYEWWLVYLVGPPLVLVLGSVLFPRLVYDQFIWQYLWGPVVADAAGEPVTHNGVTAQPGYTVVNTLVYLGAVVYMLPGLRRMLDQLTVNLNERLAFALVPFLIAGGAMRALADASLLGGYEVLFITPPIYFFVAGIAICVLVTGEFVSRQTGVSMPAFVATVGSLRADQCRPRVFSGTHYLPLPESRIPSACCRR